jgi:nucleotide-binding universal stress UspA family protein
MGAAADPASLDANPVFGRPAFGRPAFSFKTAVHAYSALDSYLYGSPPGEDLAVREPRGRQSGRCPGSGIRGRGGRTQQTARSGRTSLYDAEGKVRHPCALDYSRALQVDRPAAEVVEQADAAAEQHGYQVDVDLVEESRSDALLHDAGGAHADVLVAGDRFGLLEGAFESVGDEGER